VERPGSGSGWRWRSFEMDVLAPRRWGSALQTVPALNREVPDSTNIDPCRKQGRAPRVGQPECGAPPSPPPSARTTSSSASQPPVAAGGALPAWRRATRHESEPATADRGVRPQFGNRLCTSSSRIGGGPGDRLAGSSGGGADARDAAAGACGQAPGTRAAAGAAQAGSRTSGARRAASQRAGQRATARTRARPGALRRSTRARDSARAGHTYPCAGLRTAASAASSCTQPVAARRAEPGAEPSDLRRLGLT